MFGPVITKVEYELPKGDLTELKKAFDILDTNGNPVAAYDKNGNATLFLEDGDSHGYATISAELLKNKNTQELAERLKIKAPELKDKIYD